MNYCQKHGNHHCTHSHNCKDPNHKLKKQKTNSSSKCKSTSNIAAHKYKPPLGIIQDNQQCQFHYQSELQTGSNLTVEAYTKKISLLQSQLQISKRNFLNVDIENRKLKQKNSHVECQIQYLRQQLDVLINNHNTDISKEIKNNLVQNTSLNIKIKELITKFSDKQKQCEELSSENYSLTRKNKQLQTTIRNLQQKIRLITVKNQQLSFYFTESNSKIKQSSSELKLLKQKYSVLASSIDNQTRSNSSQINQLQNSKQKFQKLFKAKDSQNKKIKQLHDIEKKSWQKIIFELKSTLEKKQEECKRHKKISKQSEQNLAKLKDDFQHSKKIILKYQKVNRQSQNFREYAKRHESIINQDFNENDIKTIPIINQHTLSDVGTNTKIQELIKQNSQLKQKISELQQKISFQKEPLQNKTNLDFNLRPNQNQNIIINEELILSIGASQQFKKILQQKNATIKQLIKQKTVLYNKIYEQQLSGH